MKHSVKVTWNDEERSRSEYDCKDFESARKLYCELRVLKKVFSVEVFKGKININGSFGPWAKLEPSFISH